MSDLEIMVILIIVALIVYVIPAIVAFYRSHPNRWVILILNVFLGGTGIVWFGCLIWAFQAVHLTSEEGASNGGESGLNIFVNDPQEVRISGTLSVSSPTPDIADKLERLKRLRDEGVIDQAQLEQLRERIISGA